ncbi:MAG TPA: hypothetical protein VN690_10515 [Terriglobales bacterium]|nr:hypothetical protein [Terriglobales bacterium]
MGRFTRGFILSLLLAAAAWAVGGDKARYAGGTESQVKDNAEGTFSTKNADKCDFVADKDDLSIPYDQVDDLEYGQKAGRRVGLAIAVTPFALFSKKRKHFLTIGWKDDKGQQHVAVFELGKNIVRVTLATLEARTGRKIDYQDDEARKSGMGGAL